MLAACAERHADPNFAAPLGDGAREDSVEARGDEGEGEQRESAGDAREQALAAQVVTNRILKKPGARHGRSGEDAGECLPDRSGGKGGIRGTHAEAEEGESFFRFRFQRRVDHWGRGFDKAPHARILGNADDAAGRAVGGLLCAVTLIERSSEGRLPGKEVRRRRGADHADRLTGSVRCLEAASLKNARAHHIEVIGGGGFRPDLLTAEQISFLVVRVITADGKAAVDGRHRHQGRGADSG